jgi:ferrous iron transport protein B
MPVGTGLARRTADFTVALAGNPNTGKSTVFNALTGLRQHTGNWPGKTVARAEGTVLHAGKRYRLVDLPGAYSLLATSTDEEIARDFLIFERPDVTVVVVDANRLHRNLNLVLQILEITDRAVVCLNLIDEAQRAGVSIDHELLSHKLGVPVVPTAARYGRGIRELLETVHRVATGAVVCHPTRTEVWPAEARQAIDEVCALLRRNHPRILNPQWIAVRLLDGDERIARALIRGQLDNVPGSGRDQGFLNTIPFDLHESTREEDVLRLALEVRQKLGSELHDSLVETIFAKAAGIADETVRHTARVNERPALDRTLDRVLTGRWTGFPVMLLLLAIVLWLTITGANYPSALLSWFLLDTLHPALKQGAASIGSPWWLTGVLIDGAYLATAWVVSVMLPPMAIFFPLFTLLEDFGYLPRVAFNLDRLFRRAGAHGKQALTMCMGFGCNAAGVVATRVIESPRERLIAIVTNNFALCNGRWPTQILLATIFFGGMAPAWLAGVLSATAVALIALLGVLLTFLTSWGLSRTVLRGEPSAFYLELPPYRRPRLLQTLYTSLIDRTILVLWRAVVFAVPAGALIWIICNVRAGGFSLAEHLVHLLDPVGVLIGLNGVVLLAYFVAIPANEIVIPTILMLTVLTAGISGTGEGAGVLFQLKSASDTRAVLDAGGWTVLTALNVMLFSLVHNPCSTTIYTIWKETRSVRWTTLSTLLPLGMGAVLCFFVAQFWRLFTG